MCTQRCEEWETICASITLSSLPLCLDTTAGKGVLMRKGAGSVKHLDVQSLWVQECIKSRNVVMFKIAREDSPADAFAGSSSATDFTRHVHSWLTKLEYRGCRLLKKICAAWCRVKCPVTKCSNTMVTRGRGGGGHTVDPR